VHVLQLQIKHNNFVVAGNRDIKFYGCNTIVVIVRFNVPFDA